MDLVGGRYEPDVDCTILNGFSSAGPSSFYTFPYSFTSYIGRSFFFFGYFFSKILQFSIKLIK